MKSLAEMPDSNAGPTGFLRYVARQPILDRSEKVIGYELLFRDGVRDCFHGTDHEEASRSTLNTSMLMGVDVLCDGRKAFINCTRDVLLKDYVTLLPPNQAVVEILETVTPDNLVVAACQRMKAAGYTIALDDFSANDAREPLVGLADIIKVDVRQTPIATATEIVKRYGSPRCRMLAEKVETREEFKAAKAAGFDYFQGYFFRKPELMHAREIPANGISYLRLMQVISRAEPEPKEIEGVLKGDASLCYRLLRYLNSPIFGLPQEIRSISHALSMLGLRETCRWIRLAATLLVAQGKPSDLVLAALVRARMSELLGSRTKGLTSDLFLLGLLSLMNSILDVPMGLVLERIPVDQDTKNTLLGVPSPLTPIYDLLVAYERGEWQAVSEVSSRLHLSDTVVIDCHWKAMAWAREMTSSA